MLKVNEEKILQDAEALVAKRHGNLAKIETDAKEYAVKHGYSDEQTEKFVKFVQENEGNGLSAEEGVKLQILSSYIEVVKEEELKLNVVPDEASNTEAVQPIGTIVNA